MDVTRVADILLGCRPHDVLLRGSRKAVRVTNERLLPKDDVVVVNMSQRPCPSGARSGEIFTLASLPDAR